MKIHFKNNSVILLKVNFILFVGISSFTLKDLTKKTKFKFLSFFNIFFEILKSFKWSFRKAFGRPMLKLQRCHVHICKLVLAYVWHVPTLGWPIVSAGTPFRTSWITPFSKRTTACTWSWRRRTTWWSRAWSCGCAWTTQRSSTGSTRTTTPSSSSLSSTKTCPRRWLRRWYDDAKVPSALTVWSVHDSENRVIGTRLRDGGDVSLRWLAMTDSNCFLNQKYFLKYYPLDSDLTAV